MTLFRGDGVSAALAAAVGLAAASSMTDGLRLRWRPQVQPGGHFTVVRLPALFS